MNKKSGNVALGNFIKKKRLESQVTTQEMSAKLSITEITYLKYEDGSLSIFIDHLVVLSKILNVELNSLFNIYLNPEVQY